MGDSSKPYPTGMELWDTVTNNITEVAHPPGFEGNEKRFFRPVIATFGVDSIILTGSRIDTGEGKQKIESYMDNIFQYKVGTGWINLGQLKPSIDAKNQYGIYVVDANKKNTFDILTQCAS